jgi:hypothetical protein
MFLEKDREEATDFSRQRNIIYLYSALTKHEDFVDDVVCCEVNEIACCYNRTITRIPHPNSFDRVGVLSSSSRVISSTPHEIRTECLGRTGPQ